MKKKRIRFLWTCSNYEKHQHRTRLGAWLCGQRQRRAYRRALRKLRRDPGVRALAENAAELNRRLHGDKTLSEVFKESHRR